jgi:hypothetical protein
MTITLGNTGITFHDSTTQTTKPLLFLTYIYTTSGTWTKPVDTPNNAMVVIEAWGGGGSGRGDTGSSDGSGGGGGGGAYNQAILPASDILDTVDVTVGIGGILIDGGNSSFGTYLTAYGGSRGIGGNSATNGVGGPGGGQFDNSDGAPASTNASTWTGGGGGGPTTKSGGKATYGGGGGGGASTNTTTQGTGGTSINGGKGGNGARSSRGGDGTAPGGGGGGHADSGSSPGYGARGEVRVYVIG